MAIRYRIKFKDTEVKDLNLVERTKLAKNTKDINLLKELAKDEEEGVRRDVSENPNAPVDVLRELANDDDWYVRANVAKNTKDVDILRQLAKDEDEYVRYCLADNPNTPLDILKQLADDEVGDVRRAVIKNPNYRASKRPSKKENITLKDIKVGTSSTYDEPEVQQAYYFIFHNIIPVTVKNETYFLKTTWLTGDREDVYDNMDEFGENIPWEELMDEAEMGSDWSLISESDGGYIIEDEDLDTCIETMFENYKISNTDFNRVKQEILKNNKLENFEGYAEMGNVLNVIF